MGLFRNREVKRTLLIFIGCSFTAAAIGLIIDIFCGIYTLFVCAALGVIFFYATRLRYEKIAELSFQLDQVLHGNYMMDVASNREGELSILSGEIHKMTIRLREQADALAQDKMYLSNSIADISHQLRTPLTSIRLIIPRLQKNDLNREQRGELIKELNILLTRIDWLVSALLKISKIESGTVIFKKEPVRLRGLVEKAAEPLSIPMELREQQLNILIDDDKSYLGDFSWSVEAIGNILKNCMEHTPTAGTITVDGNENAIYTEIAISDSGAGFREADLPHLFERFYKGENASSANIGIGLALSKMIITGQNGTITAENNRSGGARFIVRFYKGVV